MFVAALQQSQMKHVKNQTKRVMRFFWIDPSKGARRVLDAV